MARFTVKVKKKVRNESDAQRIEIGTRSSCVVPLDDPIAADRHAAISFRVTEFVLEDLTTATGTYVNGLPLVDEHTIEDGDVIVLGRSKLTAGVVGGEDGFELVLDLEEHDAKKGSGFFVEKNDTEAEDWVRNEVRFGQFAPMRIGNWIMIVALVGLLGLVWIPSFSEPLLEPGPLVQAHAALFEGDPERFHGEVADFARIAQEEGCWACHEAFDNTPMSKCASCHDEIMRNAHPFQPEAGMDFDPAKVSRGYRDDDCLLCHVDHRGADVDGTAFKPSPVEVESKCALCHDQDAFRVEDIARPLAEVPFSHRVAVPYDGFPHAAHLQPGKAVACDVCHVRAPEGGESASFEATDDPRARHEFATATYESCDACHARDRERRDPDHLASWSDMPDELLFQVDWHGTDEGEEKCTQCHAEPFQREMRTVASREVDWLPYELQRRSHQDLFALHENADPTKCTECHVDGNVSPLFEKVTSVFRHGVHVADLRPEGDAARAAASQACAACHVEQVGATTLAEGTYLGAKGKCSDCHWQPGPGGERQDLTPVAVPPPDAVARTRTDFPHALHVGEAARGHASLEAGCYSCHDFGAGDPYDAQPRTTILDRALEASGPDTCMKCHAAHADIGGGSCQACHSRDDPVYHGEPLARPWPQLNAFDHFSPGHRDLSLDGTAGCIVCHEGIESATNVRDLPIPTEASRACRECHVEKRTRFHWR